ncbi:MAG: 6-pyruvoyl-tetrahydropterin synthase-related protein [Candidatus Gottesmanbacteria bacterium]|nr:6-pyruvoyl-tetrahydropterin synthase-related protein [Candidatus Gottesmanbacteria bacterium]
MKSKMLWISAFIAIAGAIYAVMPLFGRSYIPTHDGEYHIIRIVEFSRMLGAGYLVPRWAPDMNSGYGIPIFNYHYPLPNYVGSLVRVFTHDAVYAFQMSMGLGYIAITAASYFWLLTLFGAVPAAVGAVVAAFVPYLFVDMYVRGSIGEVWATAFLLLCFYLLEKKKLFWFALAYGFLILSHNIMAMLYTPFLLGVTLIRNKKGALWMLGGISASAFFWLPALIESKYVVGLNTVNFREHFIQVFQLLMPSWGTEFSGTGRFGTTMSTQIGIVPVMAIAAAIWASLRKPKSAHKKLFIYFLFTIGLCIMLMLPVSAFIWELITPLQLVQYPWRLLSFVIPIAGFSAAMWTYSLKRPLWGLLLAVMAVAVASSYARPVLYAPRSESYYMSRLNFTDGTSSLGNSFSTIWTGWKETRPASPVAVTNGKMIAQSQSKYLDKEFTVFMDKDGNVTVNTLYFPGWIASVDGKEVPINYRKDGIIRMSVPQGSHAIRVRFSDTPVRMTGTIISIVSVAVFAILGYTSLQ